MTRTIDVGDFITIPAWRVTGCVLEVGPSDFGSEQSVTVRLQEHPDDEIGRRYRLEPHQWESAE